MPPEATHTPFAHSAADRIDTLGEAALLCRIRQWLGSASPRAPQGIGDDCAVWPKPPQGAQLLFTTDAVVYGRHFDATCPPELAAAKLLKRNLSDIAAMGGTPHSALLALTLPRNLSLQWLERFYLGLRECSLRYATPITGGDITEGTNDFFAAHITLIGHATRPLLRSGAQVGDHLFVSGALGGSIHGHHLHFEPRLAQGQWLATQPDVRSLIDITDGLAKDLPELLPQTPAGNAGVSSHVVARQAHAQAERQRAQQTAVALLNLAALPFSNAISLLHTADLLSPIAHALLDGEDYELLFSVDGKTDPAEFIARWQTHFGQNVATAESAHCSQNTLPAQETLLAQSTPALGTPTDQQLRHPQAAWPTHIGEIALVDNHPADASRLYDAATGHPLQFSKGGFEHLKSSEGGSELI